MEAWEVTDSPNMNRPGSLRAPEGTKYGLFHRAPALPLRVTFLHCGQHYFGICAQILTSDPLLCPLWPWNKYKNMQDWKTPKWLGSVVFSIHIGYRIAFRRYRRKFWWITIIFAISGEFSGANLCKSLIFLPWLVIYLLLYMSRLWVPCLTTIVVIFCVI